MYRDFKGVVEKRFDKKKFRFREYTPAYRTVSLRRNRKVETFSVPFPYVQLYIDAYWGDPFDSDGFIVGFSTKPITQPTDKVYFPCLPNMGYNEMCLGDQSYRNFQAMINRFFRAHYERDPYDHSEINPYSNIFKKYDASVVFQEWSTYSIDEFLDKVNQTQKTQRASSWMEAEQYFPNLDFSILEQKPCEKT